MEFLTHKIYQYRDIADMIAQDAIDGSYRILGITGTSSVGKSTFSKIVQERLTFYGYSAQIISADDYLKETFRAGNNFWNRLDSTYLKPNHFDWKQLKTDSDALAHGLSIEKGQYVRGIGWGTTHIMHPTDYLIIEGLFLDSIQASDYMHYDLLLSLNADDALIRSLRIERDAYYRQTSNTFKRTEEETLQEIENTLLAGKSYQPYTQWPRHLKLNAKGNYNATLHLA